MKLNRIMIVLAVAILALWVLLFASYAHPLFIQ